MSGTTSLTRVDWFPLLWGEGQGEGLSSYGAELRYASFIMDVYRSLFVPLTKGDYRGCHAGGGYRMLSHNQYVNSTLLPPPPAKAALPLAKGEQMQQRNISCNMRMADEIRVYETK